MGSVQLFENQALVRAVHVAAWTPFSALIEGGAEFGAHRVWFLGQVLAHFELNLCALNISHM
jgi:hypothetical protein